ncbi:MAG: response regulator [Verrucomicrobiota bacterium]
MKILAIDDSPTLRKFISKHLTTYSDSYEVLLAASGEEGVSSAAKNLPDLILLDFILPDFNGDEVCRRLLDEEKTADIPVILMSSSAPDIEKNEGEFDNIVRAMIKPFSPQLLCASASSVLKKTANQTKTEDSAGGASAKETPAATATASDKVSPLKEDILLSGKASFFPIHDALLGIETEKATGILHLDIASGKREIYFREGQAVLSSTHLVDLYLSCGKLNIPEETKEYFETAKKKQEESGKPAFLQMVEDGYMPQEQVKSFTDQFGNVLFAEIWITPESPFRFVCLDKLPDFVPEEPIKRNALHWITTTLRCVNSDSPIVSSVAKPHEVLSFTADGYHKVQTMSLTQEEVSLITKLGEGNSNVGQIAQELNLQWHEMSRILFLLKKTHIIDIWPSA